MTKYIVGGISMFKIRFSTLVRLFILGGILLSLSCNFPTLSLFKSDEFKDNKSAQSLDEAAEIVINEIVQPDELDHPLIVFAWPEPLHPGDEIGPYNKSGFESIKNPTEIMEDTWFFWIDDAPGAYFMHPSRFVFINKESGQATISEEDWWPVLNGEGLWITQGDYWDTKNWIYDNYSYQPVESNLPTNRHLASMAARFQGQGTKTGAAIVINGGIKDQPLADNFKTDTDDMHDALKNSGFKVTYLGPPNDEPTKDDSARNVKDLTADSRADWFAQKAQELKPGDTLVVYIAGHGGGEKTGVGEVGDHIREDWLKTDLSRFDPGVHVIVIVQSCYSGTFTDTIKRVADRTITSTSDKDPSWPASIGDSWIDGLDDPDPDDDEGSEFSSGFIKGWKKVMADKKLQQEARRRAKKNGTGFWEEVSLMAYENALKLDATYIGGWSFPRFERGTAETKPTPSATPKATATPKPTPTQTYDNYDFGMGGSAEYGSGDYLVSMMVTVDNANHKSHIGMPGTTTMNILEDNFSIVAPSPWVNVSGEINSDGSFATSGTGTVAGYQDIYVTFQGSIIGNQIDGNYVMGANGGLPQGKSITYGVSGERMEPLAEATPDPRLAEVQAFFNTYNSKFQSGDVDGLMALLNPAVWELYGTAACHDYLYSVIENPIAIEALQVLAFESWLWEIDGFSTHIEDAYTVQVGVTAQGQTVQQSMHLGLTWDGNISWFTDCGEPFQ